MGRTPCCDKASVKRGSWSAEEDAKLKAYIDRHGTGGNWIALPRRIGLRRCGKSCRLRWLNYLRPNLKRGEFSREEDNIICRLYFAIGSRWSVIAAQLPGRTDNDIKNHWNTRLKKELLGSHQRQQQQQKARLRDGKTAEINGDPAADDVIPLGGQPPPCYADASSSLTSPASAPANSRGEASESSINGGFLTELDEIFRFESVKQEAGMSVNWNEATNPLVCSDLVDQGSQGILLQQQFTQLAHHLQHF